ncbi:MAG: hypothetical protein CMC05_10115 [Flavobacteriaceae bacterium]|nr:hypothetical protein [Flavobacteriaceae bacterium]MBD10530.1 hypothetical protein [Flavobacteriaceae bacterium]|tara:strand:+ start:1167 stop:1538 length:372 start_codon:yes stop_codon:yes gene_type:complete
MKLSKDISIDQNKLMLYYNDSETNPQEIDKTNVTELVTAVLIPQHPTTEKEGNEYFDKHQSYILNEMMEVVNENIDFYKSFIVERRFNGEGAQLENCFGRQILIKMDKRLHIELKPKGDQTSN